MRDRPVHATTPRVSAAASTAPASAVDAAWRATRASAQFQFAPVRIAPPAPPPGWLRWLGELLRAILEPVGRAIGLSWPVVEKVLVGLTVLLVLVLAWRALTTAWVRLRPQANPAEEVWVPDRIAATALLDDADRLAAQGRYGEAARLLLHRSVGLIAAARPGWLHPASTAREIAALSGLSQRARAAFAGLAERVERSLFALRDLDRADWQAARAAYADFALAGVAA